MHEDGGVVLGGGLQAELGVGSAGVIGEGDAARQLAVVQQRFVVLGEQQVALRLVFKCTL